jgi:hypothetical protein
MYNCFLWASTQGLLASILRRLKRRLSLMIPNQPKSSNTLEPIIIRINYAIKDVTQLLISTALERLFDLINCAIC